ncbi:MAG: translation elongation factor-like protein [Patescibacteria group bacterium]
MKKVGRVTHYYDHIGVAIVELDATLKVGDKVKFEGHGADFEQEVASLQIEHKPVEKASTGEVVGLKTDQAVKVGTEVEKV